MLPSLVQMQACHKVKGSSRLMGVILQQGPLHSGYPEILERRIP